MRMTVEEVKDAVARDMETHDQFPHLPLHDLVLIYQIKPEKQGEIHIPEHLREKSKGVVFVVCNKGPEASELIYPGLEVVVGAGGNNQRHIDMDDGFILVGHESIVCITNEAYVAPVESVFADSAGIDPSTLQ